MRTLMDHFNLIELPTFRDDRGALTVLDNLLPFPVVRMYWIYGADGFTRGGHRHSVTRQALIAIAGKVTVYVNDGIKSEQIELNRPNQCLLVEPQDWHTMTFEPNAILLVLASEPYNKSDYIDEPYE